VKHYNNNKKERTKIESKLNMSVCLKNDNNHETSYVVKREQQTSAHKTIRWSSATTNERLFVFHHDDHHLTFFYRTEDNEKSFCDVAVFCGSFSREKILASSYVILSHEGPKSCSLPV
jgi:hypothetical protein